jgi:hypothetical protein
MPSIIRKWTKPEKELMAKVATEIHELMNTKLGKDIPMHSQVINVVRQTYFDEISMEKIYDLDKKGKNRSEEEDKLLRVRQIIEGLQQSDMNLMLFADEDEIWMQFHMAMFLEKPTYIICEEADKTSLICMAQEGGLIKKIVYIKEHSKEEMERAMNEIKEALMRK